jgi:hypothetical protein
MIVPVSVRSYDRLDVAMNFSEIEVKVREATNPDEPWGPHGSLMNEIAQATFEHDKKYAECMMMVWKRTLKDSHEGKNWRRIYKVAPISNLKLLC